MRASSPRGAAADRASHRGLGEQPARAGRAGPRTSAPAATCRIRRWPARSCAPRSPPSTPGQAATCLTCHDGKIASAGNIANGPKDSFALASGHALDTRASAGGLTNSCASCHDPHGSASKKPMLPESKINGNAVASDGQRLVSLPVTTTPTRGTRRPTRRLPPRSATLRATRFWAPGLARPPTTARPTPIA